MADLFTGIRNSIISRLEKELDPRLGYHNLEHTIDVLEQSIRIAHEEGITDEHELLLLKTAAAYHDSGFLLTYKGHEEVSCELMVKDLKNVFNQDDLDRICGMIRATKIPQTPHNLLEKIICDADLDYLGRDDFEPISRNLYTEFIAFKILPDDVKWDHIQIGFFNVHHYFTETSIRLRNSKKEQHLQVLKERSNWTK